MFRNYMKKDNNYNIKNKEASRQCCSPESEGVIAKSKWGSNTPAAMGMAITL